MSYRHSPNSEKLYRTFYEELRTQSGLYLPHLDVYFDVDRIGGGKVISSHLAGALCHSVCMVMLFSPYYFDPNFPWCAREYAAMLELERRRRESCNALSGSRLIIPVIVRGDLPQPIREDTTFYPMERDFLAAENLRRATVRQKLAKLARDIYDRHEQLRSTGIDYSGHCHEFDLPSTEDVAPLLTKMESTPKTGLWDGS